MVLQKTDSEWVWSVQAVYDGATPNQRLWTEGAVSRTGRGGSPAAGWTHHIYTCAERECLFQDWADEEAKLQFRLNTSQLTLQVSLKACQNCPELGQDGQSFILLPRSQRPVGHS